MKQGCAPSHPPTLPLPPSLPLNGIKQLSESKWKTGGSIRAPTHPLTHPITHKTGDSIRTGSWLDKRRLGKQECAPKPPISLPCRVVALITWWHCRRLIGYCPLQRAKYKRPTCRLQLKRSSSSTAIFFFMHFQASLGTDAGQRVAKKGKCHKKKKKKKNLNWCSMKQRWGDPTKEYISGWRDLLIFYR